MLGYSFAGTVAQLAFTRHPELFASLALLGCPPDAGQVLGSIRYIGWLSWVASARMGAALMIWGLRTNAVPVAPGRLRFIRDRLTVTRRASVIGVIGLMKRTPDCRAVLASAALPKLVAVGESDLWSQRRHAAFAEAIGARFRMYRSGHGPCETAPHQLCRDLISLYAAGDAPAASTATPLPS